MQRFFIDFKNFHYLLNFANKLSLIDVLFSFKNSKS